MSDKNTGAYQNAQSGGTETPAAQSRSQGKMDKTAASIKIGIERFLQIKPQKSGFTALLRTKHKADVKTILEWEAIVKELLQKKVK